MTFLYEPGSRPLEPYTIKHALGAGGFGEVYYAVSDAGKEVALKCLRRDCDTELRGVRACLNLWHPHLVAIYDLRQSGDGTWWVIMEYVAGPTWSALLHDNPNGLKLERILPWFRQLAGAVDFLHQHGIVHRDLKPSNVFLADCSPAGHVKVGDCGLSKIMARQPSQTHTQLGTVYYMAPEMAQGKYGPAVDVYAAGVMLYQLLTGRLPFDGQSVQEILVRHLTDEPDWSGLPSVAVPVLRQALAKDPATRFGSLCEMVQQLEQSLGNASSTVARPPENWPSQQVPYRSRPTALSQEPSTIIYRPINRWYELARSLLISAVGGAAVTSFLAVIGWNLRPDIPWADFAWMGTFAVLASWALLVFQRLWWDYQWPEAWIRCLIRLTLGMLLGAVGAWLGGASWRWDDVALPTSWMVQQARQATLWQNGLRGAAYYGVLFLLTPWEHLMRLNRQTRFDWNPALLITLGAGLLVWFWQQWEPLRWAETWPKVLAASLIALLLQWASRYQPPSG
ncbi:Serine/threonine-protein kinase StkP [bacterium HR36]|nr:Serine/threonine-protein kinase StkP [bacterium HR36]